MTHRRVNRGANRKANPRSRRSAAADSAEWSTRTPSASRTSAAPEREVIARLPCLATGTPAAATTSAEVVEMLNVPEPSPPVPTTSIVPSGASTRRTRSRIAIAKPASSSTVSPRIRRATSMAASSAGVASPSMTEPIASRATSRSSVRPSMTAARAARTCSLIALPRPPRRAPRSRRSRSGRRGATPRPRRPGAGSSRGGAAPGA